METVAITKQEPSNMFLQECSNLQDTCNDNSVQQTLQTPFVFDPTAIKLEPKENEPIDLTFNDRTTTKYQNYSFNTQHKENSSFQIFTNIPSDFPKRKRTRRKLIPTANGKIFIINESNSFFYEPPEMPNKMEVMMSAKSLFSKRTRTLYHWMYPNASKQQIKLAVSSAWESLTSQEKDVYIAQVMAKFGFPQSSLMVNPQLGNIRELPPLPDVKDFTTKAYELQNAISSISQASPSFKNLGGDAKCKKRKPGRPCRPQKINKKKIPKCGNDSSAVYADLSQDFQDDPELSQELAQFAMFFKNKI